LNQKDSSAFLLWQKVLKSHYFKSNSCHLFKQNPKSFQSCVYSKGRVSSLEVVLSAYKQHTDKQIKR